MSRRGNCWGNAPMERFLEATKQNGCQRMHIRAWAKHRLILPIYMHHYNYVRGYSYNNYLSPASAEDNYSLMDRYGIT